MQNFYFPLIVPQSEPPQDSYQCLSLLFYENPFYNNAEAEKSNVKFTRNMLRTYPGEPKDK